jgi:hypothetical protein
MPFDWNLSRIKKQNIFVHEELRLPKSWKSFVGSGFAGSFNATVNGVPVTGRSLAIDPFSYPNAIVLHYLINKNDLINIAEIRQKQLEHPEQQQQQQQQQQQGNINSTTTAANGSSSSSGPSNSTNTNNTNTTKTTTTVPTLTTKTNRSPQSATVNKTDYIIGDERIFMDKKSANLHSQNMVASPKLILIAANNTTTGITTANTNRNSNTNSSTSISNSSIANKPKVSDEGVMRFALMSNTESKKGTAAATAAATVQTSSDLVTDTGAIHVIVSWTPNPLEPTKESTVKVQFSDAMTSGSLNSNVKYDLLILDKNGTTAVKKENLVAKNGLGTVNVAFPAKNVYQLEIKIKGLQKTGSVPDLSRNGIARGYVVVPEFPSAIAETLTMVGALSVSMILIRKINSKKEK